MAAIGRKPTETAAMGAFNLKLEGPLPHHGRGSDPPRSAGKVGALAHSREAGVDRDHCAGDEVEGGRG
jgi:hypothetical protein